jgi:hypothetical protein
MENTESTKKFSLLKKIGLIFIFIVVIIFCYSGFWTHKLIMIKEYAIVEESLPSNFNGLKIVHFSDIHFGKTTNEKELEKVVKEINLTNPDIVIFSGDLFDEGINLSDKNIDFLKKTLSLIKAKYQKYTIKGDNDYQNIEKYEEIMKEANFKVLNHKNELIFMEGSSPIQIAGVPSLQKEELNLNNLYQTDINNVAYKILIAHEPVIINSVKEEVNLILCGHSLGGLINFPYIGPLLKKEYTEEFQEGYYKVNNTSMYVSSGIGTENIRFRFNNAPSINLYRFYNYN